MPGYLTIALPALVALLPACLLSQRAERRDLWFWLGLALAFGGTATSLVVRLGNGWHTGLGIALWVTVAACLLLFIALVCFSRVAARLTPLLLPYLTLLGVIATVFGDAPERPFAPVAPTPWITAHIFVSVATYAILTLAAIAGLSVFLQERALKSKHPTRLSRLLPPVSDGERLQFGLLVAAALVLVVGLATGMAAEYFNSGSLLRLGHKTLLSLLTFLVVATLLGMHLLTGLRGRRAARLVLLAYLLLSLAYPGVKFVTDVLAQ